MSLLKKIIRTMHKYANQIGMAFVSGFIPPDSMRPALYRALGCKIGKGMSLRRGVIVMGDARRLVVGDLCHFSEGCFLEVGGGIEIGFRVELGHYVRVITSTHNIMNSPYRRDRADIVRAPVKIESGCWIGTHAIILPGVTIGEGCVIAAGCVVARSTEPNGLYAGVPAKRIKDLPVDTQRPFDAGVEVDDQMPAM